MKIRNYLETIAGVGIFPVISLLMFFALFMIMTLWVIRARKTQYDDVSELPFNEGEVSNEQILS